jgi:predicted nucleic-acid-binding Zn-ribbon protein
LKNTNICPKCRKGNIIVTRDRLHANAGGSITVSKIKPTEKNTALFTFYICKDCGYVEHYLEMEELEKIL